MNITIQKPYSINEIGNRVNYEDSIYPNNDYATIDNRLFLLCDGIDNSNKGKIAAAIACDSIQTYFQTFLDTGKKFDSHFIEKAIRYTEIRFDEYIKDNPNAKGMATTFCLLYFSKEGIFLAYAGDSRVYQFRKGNIILKTEDHSLINSMVKNGRILSEDANNYPQRSAVSKAIQGTNLPVDVDIIRITDIHPGDQFLMCTNGVAKILNDNELSKIFSTKTSSKEKLSRIQESCMYKAGNNYSAYVIPIHHINKMNVFRQIMASFVFNFV
jgi:protein phosphatase